MFLRSLLAGSERRFGDPGWLTRDDTDPPPSGSGVRVTTTRAMQLSTVWACVRLLANTIATLPTDIVVQIGNARFPEFQKPSWLTTPNPADPTLTSTDYFAQITTSLLLDGNFFVYCPNGVLDPTILVILDPTLVTVKPSGTNDLVPSYEVRDRMGRLRFTATPMEMLHGVWVRMPGMLRGLSPIEAARQGIGTGLATEDFAGRFFGQGAALSFGVEVPGSLDDVQKKQLKENLRTAYAGNRNSHAIGLLTGGAKFVTGLGVTNDQAQFLESRKFTVEDIAGRIFGVPPHMVGHMEPGSSSYASVEQRSLDFRQYSVLGLIRRIEDPHQRLVTVPTALSANASAFFRFNLNGLARADMKTRYDSYTSGINGGWLKPNEARALEELAPTPGGDTAYMQSQYVPLGTQPTQPAPAPAVPAPAPDGISRSELLDALRSQPAPIIALPPMPQPELPEPTPLAVRTELEYDEFGRVSAIDERPAVA